jgi:hypothetical protein
MFDKTALKRLKQQIAGAPVNKAGRRRYTETIRDEVLAVAKEGRNAGMSTMQLSRELGISYDTLVLWHWKAQKSGAAAPMLRPITLEEDAPSAPHMAKNGPVVVLANGTRIEGLPLAGIIELVRTLV